MGVSIFITCLRVYLVMKIFRKKLTKSLNGSRYLL